MKEYRLSNVQISGKVSDFHRMFNFSQGFGIHGDQQLSFQAVRSQLATFFARL